MLKTVVLLNIFVETVINYYLKVWIKETDGDFIYKGRYKLIKKTPKPFKIFQKISVSNKCC